MPNLSRIISQKHNTFLTKLTVETAFAGYKQFLEGFTGNKSCRLIVVIETTGQLETEETIGGRQNEVRTSVTHSAAPRVPLFDVICDLAHILTSSVIYY